MGTDIILLRANLLGGMNSYILELGDEDIYDVWFAEGVPDECDIDTLMSIAKDEIEFNRISYLFGTLMRKVSMMIGVPI